MPGWNRVETMESMRMASISESKRSSQQPRSNSCRQKKKIYDDKSWKINYCRYVDRQQKYPSSDIIINRCCCCRRPNYEARRKRIIESSKKKSSLSSTLSSSSSSSSSSFSSSLSSSSSSTSSSSKLANFSRVTSVLVRFASFLSFHEDIRP